MLTTATFEGMLQSHSIYLQGLLVDLLTIVLRQGCISSHLLGFGETLLFVTLYHVILDLLISHGILVTFLHILHGIISHLLLRCCLLALLILLHVLG